MATTEEKLTARVQLLEGASRRVVMGFRAFVQANAAGDKEAASSAGFEVEHALALLLSTLPDESEPQDHDFNDHNHCIRCGTLRVWVGENGTSPLDSYTYSIPDSVAAVVTVEHCY